MRLVNLVAFFSIMAGISCLTGTAQAACEEYKNLSDQETKEYRDKLLDTSADSLDRLFAFQKLVCSSIPTIRAYAIREGLKSVSDPLVREQIMFDAMFQKNRVDIELFPNSDSSENDKGYSKEHSGLLSFVIASFLPKDGCISLYGKRASRNIRYILKVTKSNCFTITLSASFACRKPTILSVSFVPSRMDTVEFQPS
jgi:hypothetical protein